MKKNGSLRKTLFISILLICCMFIAGFSAYAAGSTATAGSDTSVHPVGGNIDIDINIPEGSDSSKPALKGAALDSYYNATEESWFPRYLQMKNQQSSGLCWAFAATSAVDAARAKAYGNPVEGSPAHFGYFFYHRTGDKLGLTNDDYNTLLSSEENWASSGGNGWFAMMSIINRDGLASTGVAPFPASFSSEEGVNAGYSFSNSIAHEISTVADSVEAVHKKTGESASDFRNRIKQLIVDCGAAATSLRIVQASPEMNYKTYSHFYKGTSGTNHAVTLVGWDDNYSRLNFNSQQRPTNNGAWIVMNSWGKNWGYDNIFYVSYEDTAINSGGVFGYKARKVQDDELLYQYDGTGSCDGYELLSTGDKMANVFKSPSNQDIQVKKVGVYHNTNGTGNYRAYLYSGITDAAHPETGTLLATQDISFSTTGFKFVDFNNKTKYLIEKDTLFSVVIEARKSEYAGVDENDSYSWISFHNTTAPNESFYKSSGRSSWTDYNSKGETFRIKAVAEPAERFDLDVKDYVGEYDGNGHTGSVTPSGATGTVTLKYGTSRENCTSSTAPTFSSVGDHEVFWKATCNGVERTGTFNVKIYKINPVVTKPTVKTGVYYNGSPLQVINAGSVVDTSKATMFYAIGTTERVAPDTDAFTNLLSSNKLKVNSTGTYYLWYQVTVKDDNYERIYPTYVDKIVVTEKQPDIIVDAPNVTLTYDGMPHEVSVSVTKPTSGSGVTVKYRVGQTGDFTTTKPTFTDAGTYTVYWTAEKAELESASGSFTVTVNPITPSVTTQPEAAGTTLEFEGEALNLIKKDGVVDYGTLSYGYSKTSSSPSTWYADIANVKATEAGTYNLYYKVTGDNKNIGNVNATKFATVTVKNKSYTISYNKGDATSFKWTPSNQTKKYGEAINLAAKPNQCSKNSSTYNKTLTATIFNNDGTQNYITKQGSASVSASYKAAGWSTTSGSNSKEYDFGGTYNENKAATMYPAWNATETVKTKATVTLPSETDLTREGYDLAGFATTSDETTAAYNPGASYSMSADATLYAVWKEKTVSASASSITVSYDGNEHYVEVNVTNPKSGATVKYSYNSGAYTTTVPKFTNIGTYVVSWQATATGYAPASGSYTVTINKGNPSVTMPTPKTNLGYTGEAQVLATGGNSASGTTISFATAKGSGSTSKPTTGWVTSISDLKETNAGTYYIWYKVQGNDNYNSIDATYSGKSVTIAKADPTVVLPTACSNLEYSGTALQLATGGSCNGGTISYALGTSTTQGPSNTATWQTVISKLTGSQAKTYYIWYKVAEVDNYNSVSPKYGLSVTVTNKKYDVTYSANGADKGTAPDPQQKEHGTTLKLRDNPGFTKNSTTSNGEDATVIIKRNYTSAPSDITKTSKATVTTSYTATGWGKSANTTTKAYDFGGNYTTNEATTLYPAWSTNSSTTYAEVQLPTASELTRSGYELVGFASSGTDTTATKKPGDSYTPTGKTTTFYAVWNKAVTGVTLNKSNTEITVGNTETLTATVAPSDATNRNVTWSSSDKSVATVNDSGVVTAVAAGNATITATSASDNTKYASCTVTVNKKTYSVTYSANGSTGGTAPAAQTKIHDETLKLSTNTGNLVKADSTSTGTSVTVTVNRGYTGAPSGTQLSSIPTITKSYEAIGWNTSANTTTATYAFGGNYTANMATTLYPAWKETSTTTYAPVNLPKDWTRSGYDLLGFSTTNGATTATISKDEPYTPSKSITLYAVWAPKSNVTISYQSNSTAGGSVSTTSESLNPDASSASGSTATAKTGYKFVNWTDASGKQVSTSNTYRPSKPTGGYVAATYTANFSPISYTIAFNANGGTGTTNSVSMTYDTEKALTANGFSRSGYSFTGWNTNSDGSGDSYSNTAEVKNLTTVDGATVTLYAQWSESCVHKFTVKHTDKSAGNCVNGKGHYTCSLCGERGSTYTIAGYSTSYVKKLKVKKAKKAFTVKWKKQSSKIRKKFSGYQIKYGTSSNIKYAKSTTAKKTASSKKIKKLKAKRKYYVWVRTYRKTSAGTFYSKWTRKTVKTK